MRHDPHQSAPHSMSAESVLDMLESSPEGLTADRAGERHDEFGPNDLESEDGAHPAKLLLRQVRSPLIYLLAGAAAISLAAGKLIDSGVIAGVIVLNTVLGFIQEWRAEGALAALRQMAAPAANVLRDGEARGIDASEVVPGDMLLLEAGDRVAADARVIESSELRVDESALTGESQPETKEPSPVDEDTPVGDRRSMVWMSTHVTGGQGRAVVIATGMRSQIGAIAEEVRATGREETPLQRRMHRLGVVLGSLGIALATAVFFLGLLGGHGTVEMLLFAVAVAVSAIPEGLPAAITVALALGLRRMADRHAIVRRLTAVETLGSTTVICSDKTGTITENQMTVRRMWSGGTVFEVTGEGYDPEGTIRAEDGEALAEIPAPLEELLRGGVLTNNSRVREVDGQWRSEGDPSEVALLVAARKAGLEPDAIQESAGRIDEIPFSSDRKYMATLRAGLPDGGRRAIVKGAPDRLLDFATHVLIDGKKEKLDEERRAEIRAANERFAGEALRVMAGAYRDFGSDKAELSESDVETGLTLAGLWGMIDPPREESAPAVAASKEAGIRTVLITGDHATTALAIARKVGISESDRALTASDVESLDTGELADAALESRVFARVSPAHKLKIMEALKDHGHVVAMTGDGVNDAPALKGADIGVAMGRSGTEVAREAADMVLTDDNYATIVDAVEEGRTIYSNLRRVVFFLLATNLGEILTLTGALVLGMGLPLTAVMILWVNLVTDGACTVPLGVEPRHWNVLKEPPRDPKESIVNRPMVRRMAMLTPIMAAGTLGLFHWESQTGDLQHARTVAFTTLAAFQWFQALNARSQTQSVFSIGLLGNRWLLVGLGVAVAMQFLVVHTPLGQQLFGTTHLSSADWLRILLVSSSIWLADEIRKRLEVEKLAVAESRESNEIE
ncbi:MAG: HAD-IC family P-type ATPase [Candidatus Eisenbacteria bacterium]|nr:HAD-IC family P-type ATPase [Candidatus Eisenbacteria bacterium]